MSGPKTTRIRIPDLRRIQEQLVPLATALAEAARGHAAVTAAARSELEGSIKALREELRRFSVTGERRVSMLDSLRAAEAALQRLSWSLADAPTQSELQDAAARLAAVLAARDIGAVEAVRGHAVRLLERARHAHAREAELREAVASIRAAMPGTGGSGQERDDVATRMAAIRRELEAVARRSIDAEATALAGADAQVRENLRLGGLDHENHADSIRAALDCVSGGDLEGAARHVESARTSRITAEVAAGQVLAQIETRETIAAHLQEALLERHYDRCHAYLLDGPGGEERPLVLYARNPAGNAHVRLTLAIDGGMNVEIDDVAEGEEELCVGILEAFRTALDRCGHDFEVMNGGRATECLERQRMGSVERLREKARQREGKR